MPNRCRLHGSLRFAATHPAVARRQAYARVRQQEGMDEMGDLVLALSTELMTSFDFYPTFTSPFDVSNKVNLGEHQTTIGLIPLLESYLSIGRGFAE